MDQRIPLWAFFIAVQLLDVFWAPFVLLGVERVRIVPGITASSPLDLYYMPYTHSLVAAVVWSLAACQDASLAVVARDEAKAYIVESSEYAAKDRPEIAIEADTKPWGALEVAVLDKTGVWVIFRQW